jgi:hypothetical protein
LTVSRANHAERVTDKRLVSKLRDGVGAGPYP